MKYSRKIVLTFSLLLFAFSSNLAVAKGAEIKFSSLVGTISQTDGREGTVTVSIHGIDVSVIINGDTEIESGGEEIDLPTLSVGDFVRIRAFFSDAGIVADEVNVLDERSEQFRFRGLITDTDTLDENTITIITIMGVDVYIDSATDITRRGSGDGNSVAATELMKGDEVNVRGGSQDGFLLAARIHVGNREQGDIELEGEIVAVNDSGFTIDIRGGGTTDIIVDGDTSVSGDIIVGAFVEIEGQLDSAFAVLAFEVVVDVDGDGDADDDNKRGRRGHGSGDDDNDNDNNDDSDAGNDVDNEGGSIEVGAEISLNSASSELNGKAETRYRETDGSVSQKFEIEIEDAVAEASYVIVVLFGSESVEFGSITANDLGAAEVEYKTGDEDPDLDLSALLPDGSNVRDITGVQILLDGDIVLEGDF